MHAQGLGYGSGELLQSFYTRDAHRVDKQVTLARTLRVESPVRMGCFVIVVALSVVFTATLAQGADPVDGKFQAFGATRLVVGGIPPDNNALDLTSNCGPQTYNNTCYYNAAAFVYSGVAFVPNKPFPLSSISDLATDYNVGGSDCGAGSPRFVIILSSDHDSLEGYFGRPPNFTDCLDGWENTGNLTTDTTTRWVFKNRNTLMTWSQIEATYGTHEVTATRRTKRGFLPYSLLTPPSSTPSTPARAPECEWRPVPSLSDPACTVPMPHCTPAGGSMG